MPNLSGKTALVTGASRGIAAVDHGVAPPPGRARPHLGCSPGNPARPVRAADGSETNGPAQSAHRGRRRIMPDVQIFD